MLTGVIHRLCISGSSQGKQVRGPTFLDEKHTHAGEGCSFSLRPRQAASICHFQGRTGKKNKIKFYPDTFPDRCTQQAASNSSVNRRMSQGAQNKRKRQPFLFSLRYYCIWSVQKEQLFPLALTDKSQDWGCLYCQ